jgi:uncharacterized membrane protein YdjX (TVP38/TMEM64 family)
MHSEQDKRAEADQTGKRPESEQPLANGGLNEPLTDFNRYSVKFDLEDDEEEPAEAPRLTGKQIAIYSAVAVVGVLLLYLIVHHLGKEAFELVLDTLRKLVKSNNPLSYLLLILFQFLFGWILFMPGLSTFNILQAFLMQSFWKSFLLSFIGTYLASISLYIVIKKYFRSQIIEKFRRKILFRIVYLEVKKRPWQMGLLFNLLFIPISLKNYLMPLTSITLEQYAIVLFPVHMFYCAMFAFIGYSVKDINSLFHDGDESFSDKSTAAKIQTVMTYVLLALTIGLMIAFFFMAKKKYAEIEEEHKLQAVEAKEKLRELDQVPVLRNVV